MTRRRFIADIWDRDHKTAALTGDQASHLARVLRAEPGQTYDLVAGGFLHRAEIATVLPDRVTFALHEELEADSALPLHLLLAIFKFDHFEWAVEKATELGIARVTPILARRTEKHLAQAAGKRVERWRRIALEASKQSRRTSVPEIADPSQLTAALTTETASTRILLSELEQATPLQSAVQQALDPDETAPSAALSITLSKARPSSHAVVSTEAEPHGETPGSAYARPRELALAIGPEGGWTPEEIDLFRTHGWQPVTLGPRILRAETAAIAAIAITGAALSSPYPRSSTTA